MSGTFNDRGELEPSAAAMIFCTGPKGSGKSVMGSLIASTWPNDAVVIDVAGDDGPAARTKVGTHDVHDIVGTVDELPRKWPEYLRSDPPRPMILHYLPDAGSATALQDIDAMVGLAYNHSTKDRPALLLVHETGVAAPVNGTPAHMRRVLNHSRHHALTAIFCGPRPMEIATLVHAQADLIYMWELPAPQDRQRLAHSMGWNVNDLAAAMEDLKPYEYLRFDRREAKPEHPDDDDMRLIHFPALPEDVVADVVKWAAGEPEPAR